MEECTTVPCQPWLFVFFFCNSVEMLFFTKYFYYQLKQNSETDNMMSSIKCRLFCVAAWPFQFSCNNVQIRAMGLVWHCNGSQRKVLPLTWMHLPIRYKKEKTEYILPWGSHKPGFRPNAKQIQGLLKQKSWKSKSKPVPDSSFSLPIEAVGMKHVLPRRLQFSQEREIMSTLSTVCESSVRCLMRTVQEEGWVRPHPVLQCNPVPAPCKHN